MRYLRILAMLGITLTCASYAHAQRVVVGVGVGGPGYFAGPPVCSYGYYDYAPYACAPYGYYGANWFANGLFIGAGPWYHGYGWGRGYYGRAGWGYGRGYYGGRGFYRGAPAVRGAVGGGFHGAAVRGGGGFHGG